jgi:hypothetical protein
MLIECGTRRAYALLSVVLLAAVPQVHAQGQDDVNGLPTEGRQLTMDTEVSGLLTDDDVLWWDGTYVQAWTLMLQRDQDVTVDLLSDEFDAFLMVAGPGIENILTDDDGAGACHSRLSWTAGESGVYRVVVNTIGEGATGGFLLRITQDPDPEIDEPCGEGGEVFDMDLTAFPVEGRMLTVGQEAMGTLTGSDREGPDGAYAQAWGLALSAGQEVTVDLVSDDFDAFLWLGGPGLASLSDDDGAGACHSRITFTAPDDGLYRVVASTLAERMTGSFVLRVSRDPGPVVSGSCGGDDFVGDAFGTVDLSQYPVEGRMLAVGQEAVGTLTGSDGEGPDGAYMQAWGLALSAGQEVTVDLVSDEFDAFLWLGGPGLDNLTDDDGAGACDSRITLTAPEDGLYRIVASTLSAGMSGSFVLRVMREPGPLSSGPCGEGDVFEGAGVDFAVLPVGGRRLELGSKVSGQLTSADTTSPDGSYLQAWGLVMSAGETLTVDLVSGDFDAFLWLAGPGLDAPMSDDDGGGACNSRITFAAPTDGIYRVVVNTVSPGATGAFRLLVSAQPGPMAQSPCAGGGGVEEPTPVAVVGGERLAELDVQPRSIRLAVGERAEVLATAYDADGEPVLATEFAWVSADRGVVEPEPDRSIPGIAFLTGRGGGSTVVRVNAGGLTRSVAVRVVGPTAACTNPGPDYNADGSCFDAPPAPQGPPLLAPPASLTERPTPATLWVKVGEDGRATEVRRLQDSDQVRFTIAAIQFVHDSLTYRPARRDGQPVVGWLQLRVVPRGR